MFLYTFYSNEKLIFKFLTVNYYVKKCFFKLITITILNNLNLMTNLGRQFRLS